MRALPTFIHIHTRLQASSFRQKILARPDLRCAAGLFAAPNIAVAMSEASFALRSWADGARAPAKGGRALALPELVLVEVRIALEAAGLEAVRVERRLPLSVRS